MGIMVYSLLWVMQDLYHQPYRPEEHVLKDQILIRDMLYVVQRLGPAAN